MKNNDGGMMVIESKSIYNFARTAEELNSAILNSGWKIPAIHDLQNTIRNFGKEVLPVKIFELCHPKHSSRLLELDNERLVSIFMPCRISVYEKSDGKVYISRLNAIQLSKSFGGIVEEVMTLANNEMEEIISKLIK
jgi:uncharacterized protein (DUF302 family)